jgi:hypothetical protein
MPALAKITQTFFTDLINRLGIRPPFGQGFEISNVVQPVSIVDSGVTLSAISSTQTLDTGFSAGRITSPGANTIFADTGPLPAARYAVYLEIGKHVSGTQGQDFAIQRRNAANSGNIWELIGTIYGGSMEIINRQFICQLQENERIRIISINAGTPGIVVEATIFVQPVV